MPCVSIGPKLFWTGNLVAKSFLSGPRHFGPVQTNLDESKIIRQSHLLQELGNVHK